MLAKRGYNKIDVYDRLTMPASPDDINEYSNLDRSYMIGVTGRGQILLDKLGVMPTLDAYSAMVRGRKDWAPGNNKRNIS
jgi:2-polyprenyl-6-methoxyphenol hydroxylase-like FAD-dependent oxidoreductase